MIGTLQHIKVNNFNHQTLLGEVFEPSLQLIS